VLISNELDVGNREAFGAETLVRGRNKKGSKEKYA